VNDLANRTCFITGASRGLGAQIAKAFWKAGANLILVARARDGLAQVQATLPPRPDQRAVILAGDLSDPQSIERMVSAARNEFEQLDVLVNNAAIQGPIGAVWKNDWHAWQTTVQVNLLAPIALCRLGVPWMAECQRGKIINLSGGGATGPRARFSAYATAKAGLVQFSETLAEETRAFGIDVNCVAPGAMDTALLAQVIAAGPVLAGQREYDAAREAQSAGEAAVERAAALCVFLASPASDGITGKLLSAIWDPWEGLVEHKADLNSDIYTLRRIVPGDRGKDWG
jgi:NAD(P)-dependent dehydrogenase (short-subunit alcohol dehydrogenase family)